MANRGDLNDINIKLGPTISKDRYICTKTGAHFEWMDMVRRLKILEKERIFDPRASGSINP